MIRIVRTSAIALLVVATTAGLPARASSGQPQSPTYDVVSIKRNTAGTLGSTINERPDGGFTMTNVPVISLIGRAWPVGVPAEWLGVPEWARQENYDVSATSSLASASADDRHAMLRAMLADRFRLVVHVEQREQQVFDLVLARADGRLGPGLQRLDVDCDAQVAARTAAAQERPAGTSPPARERPDFNVSPPPCTLRSVGAGLVRTVDRLEGEASMAQLAGPLLRMATGRTVVDKTGLPGSYRILMDFDMAASRRGPDPTAPSAPGAAATIFTAIQEQLGLKLEASRALRDTLVIDRIERPTEN